MGKIQANQGYFQSDGRLVFDNALTKPPLNKKVIFFWEEEVAAEKNISKQQQAILDALTALEGINSDDFTTDDIDSFERLARGEYGCIRGEAMVII